MKLILYIPEKEIPTKQDIISIDIHFMDGKIVECDCPFIELKQEPCEDAISRQAVEDKLLKLCNELEGIFANIRMQNQDESVCGLCEYDCPAPYECPGFDIEDCFKLADEIRHKWQSTKDLPSVNPQEPKTDVLDKIRAEIEQLETYYDNDYFSGNRDAMFKCNDVLEIIDKYKTESEE